MVDCFIPLEIQNKISSIYNNYGLNEQAKKLIEECAELIKEICCDEPEKMAQEMADVYIVMTGILQNNPDLKEIFDEELEFKVNRQLERISNEMFNNNEVK